MEAERIREPEEHAEFEEDWRALAVARGTARSRGLEVGQRDARMSA